ncbi:RusA family crossover junction endodeoxyribonuclease [Succinivibrio dextrinosolvens]|uniref:Holliday junction resolvase RusA (Prophage-encoded endonuclease) n=1 Tax=Succinivibrio dextrinosolvens TaxID=83771 RepID=A0A662Z9R8_9GAMM|nr:RusA family crossover junction endodeoxyribonuclease [Succinivibrio dextrinosolvens]SFJ74768.1 Holliday junction resolvase RusA (prophage-encoded endonuclease) [Succinivibrio dextrinosolvens]
MKISFFVPGKPRGKGRPRFFKGHAVTDSKTREYEALVGERAQAAMNDLARCIGLKEADAIIDKPCDVYVVAFFAVPKSYSKVKRECALNQVLKPNKPDADNIAKIVLDGMNGIAFSDDAHVWRVVCEKRYSDTIEGVQVNVYWEEV